MTKETLTPEELSSLLELVDDHVELNDEFISEEGHRAQEDDVFETIKYNRGMKTLSGKLSRILEETKNEPKNKVFDSGD